MSKRPHEDGPDAEASAGKVARSGAKDVTLEAFKAHVAGLNAQFASWVAQQRSQNPNLLWLEGAKDYVKHAEGLLTQFKEALEDGSAAPKPAVSFNLPATSPTPSTGFSFGASGSAAPAAGGFMFGSGSAAAKPGDAAPSTSAAAFSNGAGPDKPGDKQQSPPPFSFGLAKAATPAAGSSPGESAEKAGAAPAPAATGLFGFKPPAFAAAEPDKAVAPKPFTFGAAAAAPSPAASSSAVTGAASAPALGAAATAASIFGAPAPSSTGAAFTFGASAPASSGAAASGGSIFGSSTPAFSFGKPPAAAASGDGAAAASAPAASTGFSFGASAPASGAGFSFPSSTTVAGTTFTFGTAAGAAPAGGADDDDGADPDAEKPVDEFAANPTGVQVDESVEVLYKAKARLMVGERDDEGKLSWQNRGLGFLTLRRAKAGGDAKPFITFGTETGRVLFTSYLTKTLKFITNDKSKSVAFSAPYAAEAGAAHVLTNLMFQMLPPKNKEFKEAAEKLQAEL